MASFGIGPSLASYGTGRTRSPSLTAMGISQEQEADKELGTAASEESQRNAANEVAKAQAKAGNEALGSTLGGLAGYAAFGGGAAAATAATAATGAAGSAATGASAGSAIGPWGTVIGGVLGAIAGAYLSR